MNKHMYRLPHFLKVVLFAYIIILTSVAYAQNERKIKVLVSIKIDEKQSLFQSLIHRELREIKDVEIVYSKEEYDYELSILGLANHDNSGIISFGVSVLYVSPAYLPESNFYEGIYGIDSLRAKQLYQNSEILYSNKVEIMSHEIRMIGISKVEQVSKEIVAEFDMFCLEGQRKIIRELNALRK
jgi:hypothetical protein